MNARVAMLTTQVFTTPTLVETSLYLRDPEKIIAIDLGKTDRGSAGFECRNPDGAGSIPQGPRAPTLSVSRMLPATRTRRRPGIALAPWALGLLPLGDGGADWPRWRGANFDDSTEAGGLLERPFTLRERWRVEVGSGYSGISVLGATAVTLGASEGFDQVVALDTASGAVRWRRQLGPAFPGKEGAVDGPTSTPTLADDTAYVLGPRGELLALALADGAVRWSVPLAERHHAPAPHFGFTTAPLVVGDLVVVAAGAGEDAAFLAFARADGTLRWSAGTDTVHYQSPILARMGGEELLVGAGNSFLFGLDPADGSVRWRLPHAGSDFEQETVQPLALLEDELLLKTQRMFSRRVRVEGEGTSARLETSWNSRYLSQNYTALHWEGLLFGHTGDFLSCLDAESGDLLWRSRPPGNGWVIRVDSWLVILTKEGSLHFAPALAEGYEEHASMPLFERLAWTPPSFARGAVFARDSSGVAACVEVLPAPKAVRAKAADPAPVPALFAALERDVAASSLPTEVVDEFLARNGPFPRIEDERVVHFVYRGAAQDIVLVGDMLDDSGELALRRVPGTDLFFATCELAPDARVGYQFVRDLDQTLTDPLNPRTTNSLTVLGEASELCMPRAPKLAESAPPARSGTREDFALEVPVSHREDRPWGGRRRVWVHLPPGYGESEARYPVLLVNDAANALGVLDLPAELDRLSGTRMRPVIAVFVELQSAWEFARSERDLYRDLLLERVLPEIDTRYRTLTDPASRAVLGFGEGAYAALFAALSRPGPLGAAAAVSLNHGSSQGQRELESLVAAAESLPFVCLDWGRYDSRESARGFDTDASCRALAAALEARGARVRALATNDGDQCSFWRARLPDVLGALFPPAR